MTACGLDASTSPANWRSVAVAHRDALLIFSRNGSTVAQVRTGVDVRLNSTPRIGFSVRPESAHVSGATNSRLDFLIDTGIR
jgi:hypothetical protein